MPNLLNDALAEGAIALQRTVSSWQECFEVSGELLVRSNRAKPEYTRAMIDVFHELGPYMVIAPGVALAHAKPGDWVVSPGLSLLTLSSGVNFGVERFDPVRIVFGLTAIEHDDHISLLAALSEFLLDEAKLNSLLVLDDVDSVRALFS
jgi:ascorbate PTS system EIIA or EIIAB component